MPGGDKSRTYLRYVVEIINFTNYRAWLFFNKHIHKQNFSFSFLSTKGILKNQTYTYLTTISSSGF